MSGPFSHYKFPTFPQSICEQIDRRTFLEQFQLPDQGLRHCSNHLSSSAYVCTAESLAAEPYIFHHTKNLDCTFT